MYENLIKSEQNIKFLVNEKMPLLLKNLTETQH
jgi:hypothetical protein